MAGPMDLKGRVVVTDGATGPLRAIKGELNAIAGATQAIKPPALAASMSDLKRLQAEYRKTWDAMRAPQGNWFSNGSKAASEWMRGWKANLKKLDEHPASAVAAGAMGGHAIKAAAAKVTTEGASWEQIKQQMAFAGVKPDEVGEATHEARKLSGKYTNMSATQILELINESRMIYGDQHTATHHADPMVRMGAFLKSYDGGKHEGTLHDLNRELIAGIKSGEIAGNITPEAMEKSLGSLVAMRVAYGNQVKISDFLQAQRSAGVSFLAASDDYKYGIFPALVQEYGSGAGVMMQTAATKLLADVGHKKYAMAAQQDLGIRDDEGKIVNQKLYGQNPLEWVMKELQPRLQPHLEGLSKGDQMTKIVQMLGQMFPDRNAAKQLAELLIQTPKLLKDGAQIKKIATDAKATTAFTDENFWAQTQAFGAQWSNLLTALSSPMIPTATAMMKQMTDALAGFAKLTTESPGKAAGLGAGAVVGGGVLSWMALKRLSKMPGGRALLGLGAGAILGGGIEHGIGGALLGYLVGKEVAATARGARASGTAAATAAKGGALGAASAAATYLAVREAARDALPGLSDGDWTAMSSAHQKAMMRSSKVSGMVPDWVNARGPGATYGPGEQEAEAAREASRGMAYSMIDSSQEIQAAGEQTKAALDTTANGVQSGGNALVQALNDIAARISAAASAFTSASSMPRATLNTGANMGGAMP